MTTKNRPPALTERRLRAISMALNAMLAGEEGEGDWDPIVSRKTMEEALDAIDARLVRAEARREENADRLSMEAEQDYLEQNGDA